MECVVNLNVSGSSCLGEPSENAGSALEGFVEGFQGEVQSMCNLSVWDTDSCPSFNPFHLLWSEKLSILARQFAGIPCVLRIFLDRQRRGKVWLCTVECFVEHLAERGERGVNLQDLR